MLFLSLLSVTGQDTHTSLHIPKHPSGRQLTQRRGHRVNYLPRPTSPYASADTDSIINKAVRANKLRQCETCASRVLSGKFPREVHTARVGSCHISTSCAATLNAGSKSGDSCKRYEKFIFKHDPHPGAECARCWSFFGAVGLWGEPTRPLWFLRLLKYR